MDNSGNCSLIIRGENIDFIEIEDNLQIKPSRTARKGELISKAIGKSHYDVWVYQIGFDGNRIPENALESLLKTIKPSTDYLNSISNFSELIIKCYVQSDYAQINFEISPKILRELANINIKFEISILSWGGAMS